LAHIADFTSESPTKKSYNAALLTRVDKYSITNFN